MIYGDISQIIFISSSISAVCFSKFSAAFYISIIVGFANIAKSKWKIAALHAEMSTLAQLPGYRHEYNMITTDLLISALSRSGDQRRDGTTGPGGAAGSA